MAVIETGGKKAVTRYTVMKKGNDATLVHAQPETGRTHQIRVHMAHIKHPLLGDSLYGGRQRILAGVDETLAATIKAFRRQALHAERLSFEHPGSRESVSFEAALPDDFSTLLEALKRHD